MSAPKAGRSPVQLLVVGVVVILLVITGLGMYWSVQPKPFDVIENVTERAGSDAITGSGRESLSTISGDVYVSTALRVAETLMKKPGGFIKNDVLPPGILIDNMPNWEYGVLTELRDTVRSLRNEFSRSQSQSIESDFLKKADSDFAFRSDAWFLPSAEEMYRDGIKQLEGYLAALMNKDSNAGFFARADNLRAHLMVIEKRLGSYGQELAASVADAALVSTLAGKDSEMSDNPSASQADVGAPVVLERTPWTKVDDVFYQARGYSWALLHMMQAIEIEFRKVLEDKNAEVSMQQIIRELEKATVRKHSPMVLNGHGFGVLANHSLILASYIGRANAAIIDLRMLLERG
ncbi:DUF2333 family protein [Lamprobacter modestohalophilus]|uniref:DUF2333 family protein n=1 Tax=Lamprobacter modestohalophilus TaxID=1064514 RepID=UPI002ADEE526|nr:DUF2333 family protein [Lamprobacter modestohalophilus]MEA1051546.1 DUF2333 family protein [Lamprobacter modestohalophilus]